MEEAVQGGGGGGAPGALFAAERVDGVSFVEDGAAEARVDSKGFGSLETCLLALLAWVEGGKEPFEA